MEIWIRSFQWREAEADAIARLDRPHVEGWNGPPCGGGEEGETRGDGRRWWVLFYTLIYCRRYFLVGASWRLPHHRTRQWVPAWHFVSNYCPAGRSFLFQPRRGHRHRRCALLFFFPRHRPLCWTANYAPCARLSAFEFGVPRIYPSPPQGFSDFRFRRSTFDGAGYIRLFSIRNLFVCCNRDMRKRGRESKHMSWKSGVVKIV